MVLCHPMSDRFDHTLERKLESNPDEAEGASTCVRRLELITGTGRRRRWSSDDRSRIVVESLRPGANVSEVARRNGLSPQQLFGWRREARALFDEGAGGSAVLQGPPSRRPRGRPRKDLRQCLVADAPAFAPVVVAAPAGLAKPMAPAPAVGLTLTAAALVPAAAPLPGTIEITLGTATVRIGGDVEVALIAAVLGALRRAP